MLRLASSLLLLLSLNVYSHGIHSLKEKKREVYSDKADFKWYRGNTHSHTVLSGHADSTPEEVTAWYHENGYNFLVLSEHNKFIDPASVDMPTDLRDDFILIPGQEITGQHHIHTTAINSKSLIDWRFRSSSKRAVIQNHVNGSIRNGAEAILNHPNWQYSLKWRDILGIRDLKMMELYNGHPGVNNWGDEQHLSVEAMWDNLLTQGMKIYAVASDDVHILKERSRSKTNPGRGWVMVRSQELSPDAITNAMTRGDFYATSGVMLEAIVTNRNGYYISVDKDLTKETLKSKWTIGRIVGRQNTGYKIEFIGPLGRVLSSSNGLEATFTGTNHYRYVRAKVTYTEKRRGIYYQFYAWGQPVFGME